jgi:aldehyde dehydrogenase (NAD+)
MAKYALNYIAGKWVKAENGNFFENRNPADSREVIGMFPESRAEDVENAFRAA